MTIDINKKYRTSDGDQIRILATDIVDKRYPVIAAKMINGEEIIQSFTSNGAYYDDGAQSLNDLIEVKPAVVGFANVYPTGSIATGHTSLNKALHAAGSDLLGVLELRIEDGQAPTFTFHPKEAACA